MIVTAVICPPAPLLVPGLADRLAAGSGELRAACDRAVACLRAVQTVVILSAGSGAAVGALPPGRLVTAAGLARSDHPVVAAVRLPGGPSAQRPPAGDDAEPVGDQAAEPAGDEAAGTDAPATVGTVVGAHLLARAGIDAPTSAVQVGSGAVARTPEAGRTGLLVMADGAACHGDHAPGGPDPRSESFDRDLVTALRSGDPGTLAETCARLADLAAALRAQSLPALAALAAATVGRGRATAEVLHDAAPFGVGYPVAVWQWESGR